MSHLSESDSSDCRSRLVEAATEVFLEDGYRASLDRVAARAGVARQTLYNHFECKAELFGEVVRQATVSLLLTLDGEGQTLRERLLRFGLAYRTRLLSSEGLNFFRTLAAESSHFPELVGRFYRSGPARTAARVREVLEAAMASGEMRPADPEFATVTLLSMLVGVDRSRYLFSGEPPPDPDPDQVDRIIDAYLRAFAPEPCHPSPTEPARQRSIP